MIPILETDRLLLRPFKLSDAKEVYISMNDPEIYLTTLNIPKSYTMDLAISWIKSHELVYAEKGMITLAGIFKETSILVGAFTLSIDRKHNLGEVGYWIRKDCWNNGYGTEGTRELINYGFNEVKINKIIGRHFKLNTASGKVMEKCGMLREGVHQEAICKEGFYHDVVFYSILRSSWLLLDDNIKNVDLIVRKLTTNDIYSLYFIHYSIDKVNKWNIIKEAIIDKRDGLNLIIENNRIIGYEIAGDMDKCGLNPGKYIVKGYEEVIKLIK